LRSQRAQPRKYEATKAPPLPAGEREDSEAVDLEILIENVLNAATAGITIAASTV